MQIALPVKSKEIPSITGEMRRASTDMRAAGVNIVDASNIFDDVSMESVYGDQSGHLNEGGLDKVVAMTLDTLIGSTRSQIAARLCNNFDANGHSINAKRFFMDLNSTLCALRL
jgi:hypothetical protein